MRVLHNNFKIRYKVIFSVFTVTVLNCSESVAYEFIKDFSLPATVQYDDNVTLSSGDTEGAFRYILRPELNLSTKDEINEFSVDASLNIVRSNVSENLILDREDPTFNARWGHTFNRGRFSVGGGYTRTSVLVSEFDQTGLVFQDGNSTNRYISSNLTYEVTDRISTIFNVRLNKQKYDQSNLTDFKSYITSLQVGYDYSEKLNVYMGAGYSKFLNEQDGQAVLSTQSGDQIMRRLSLGVNYDYSPVMNIGFSAGANEISTGGGGWVATANLNYVPSDYTTLTTSYNRSNTASGLGGFQSSDNINILFTTAVSDFDEIGVSFLWNKNRSLNTNTTKQFNAFYTHIISPNWSAIAAFNHRYGSSSLRDSATGAQINFTLSYNISNF